MKKIKGLLYCTKAKPYLVERLPFNEKKFYQCRKKNDYHSLNGTIVAECEIEVEEITNCGTSFMIMKYDDLQESYRYTNEIARGSCLDYNDLKRYLGANNGYAIHIKNLHIFDKPINIRNYYNIATRTMEDCLNQKTLLKAPQNMCNAYDVYKNHYIVISIQPKELCRIINGEQTILIKKKVLNCMKGNK